MVSDPAGPAPKRKLKPSGCGVEVFGVVRSTPL